MRVERALEKLRAVFLRRGIAATTTLASVISANAVQIAPAGLAATLTNTSLAAAGTGTLTLLKLMTMTKLSLSALVIAGATTALVVQHQAQIKLRGDNESLRRQIAQLQADNENLSNLATRAKNPLPLSDDQLNELLKLRGEAEMLRQRTNELGKLYAASTRAIANQQQLEDDSHAEQEKAALFKMNIAKQSVMAMIMYANDNGDQFPANFDQAAPYFKGDSNSVRSNLNQFEVVYQGSWKNITDPASTIVVRGNLPWLEQGEWINVYGFADGHSELHAEPDGNFGAWEQEHLAAPPPGQ